MAKNDNMFVTPAGTARFVHLHKPDTKFDSEGNFNCQLILTAEDFNTFKAKVDAFVKTIQWKSKKLSMPWEELDDGTFAIRAKSSYRVPLFDSKNNKVFDTRTDNEDDYPRIGGGSRMKLFVKLNDYHNKGEGVSLFLNSAQILELVEFGGGCPFDVEDDGYVVEDEGSSPFVSNTVGSALEI